MPVSTYLVLVENFAKGGPPHRLVVVADSTAAAREKARANVKGQVVKVVRLHPGPPKKRKG